MATTAFIPSEVLPARRRFTVAEYHRMAEAGILHEDDRVELLDGQIVEMTPIGNRHVACVNRVTDLVSRLAGNLAMVSVQNPLVLPDRSEPQPDIVVLKRGSHFAGAWLPSHEDTWLVVEVADTSLEHDRDVKIPLYAAAGISESWLVNLRADAIAVYREPGPDGYRSIRVLRRGDNIMPLRLPGVTFKVDDILG